VTRRGALLQTDAVRERLVKLTVVRDSAGVLDGSGGGGRTRLPELPPGLLLLGLLGVRVGSGVAVEEDVLLERRVLVHALELGHGDDGLLPLSGAGGAGALNIVVGRHLVELRNAVARMYYYIR